MAEFKDLVIDAVDSTTAQAFWARILGLSSESTRGPDFVLRGLQPADTVWINAVPEPKTVKNRVHLDVHVAQLESLVAAGAEVQDDAHRWTIMTDPDGQEFCAFVRDPARLPELRMYELVVDTVSAGRQAHWWADRFGLEVQEEGDGSAWIGVEPDLDRPDDPVQPDGGLPWPMIFVEVPESKTVKNRVHWDVWGETAEFLDAGATLLRARDEEISWDVLADPEGNEFCVFAPEG